MSIEFARMAISSDAVPGDTVESASTSSLAELIRSFDSTPASGATSAQLDHDAIDSTESMSLHEVDALAIMAEIEGSGAELESQMCRTLSTSAPMRTDRQRMKFAACSVAGSTSRGHAKNNQDHYGVVRRLGNLKHVHLFMVADGHGPQGAEVSFATVDLFPRVLTPKLLALPPTSIIHNPDMGHFECAIEESKQLKQISRVARDAIREVQRRLFDGWVCEDGSVRLSVDATLSGTTLCVLLLVGSHLITINVGDSMAILGRDKRAKLDDDEQGGEEKGTTEADEATQNRTAGESETKESEEGKDDDLVVSEHPWEAQEETKEDWEGGCVADSDGLPRVAPDLTVHPLSVPDKPGNPCERARIERAGGIVARSLSSTGVPVGPLRVWLPVDHPRIPLHPPVEAHCTTADSVSATTPPPAPSPPAANHTAASGTLVAARGPGVAMSRSVGDYFSDIVGVICDPIVTYHFIRKHRDIVLVLASDGVWEFMTPESVLKAAVSRKDPSSAARCVCRRAERTWSRNMKRCNSKYVDDITVIIIRLWPE